jgi:hypothetical protein
LRDPLIFSTPTRTRAETTDLKFSRKAAKSQSFQKSKSKIPFLPLRLCAFARPTHLFHPHPNPSRNYRSEVLAQSRKGAKFSKIKIKNSFSSFASLRLCATPSSFAQPIA